MRHTTYALVKTRRDVDDDTEDDVDERMRSVRSSSSDEDRSPPTAVAAAEASPRVLETRRGLSPERDLDRDRKVSFSTAPIPVSPNFSTLFSTNCCMCADVGWCRGAAGRWLTGRFYVY